MFNVTQALSLYILTSAAKDKHSLIHKLELPLGKALAVHEDLRLVVASVFLI